MSSSDPARAFFPIDIEFWLNVFDESPTATLETSSVRESFPIATEFSL